MVRPHHRCNKSFRRGTHERTDRRPNQTRKRWVQIKLNKIRIFQIRDRMDHRSPDRPGMNPTIARQVTGDKRIKTTEQRERVKIISGSHPVFVKIH